VPSMVFFVLLTVLVAARAVIAGPGYAGRLGGSYRESAVGVSG